MELQKLTNQMIETSARIDKATKEIHKMAKRQAQAEFEYRKALGQQITTLKAENMPVTLIADIARSNVADLKLERDLSEGLYKSSIESLRALQSELSGLQTVARYQDEY